MRGIRFSLVDSPYAFPVSDEHVDDVARAHTVAVVGADVVPALQGLVLILRLRDHEICEHRLEDMLVRSCGIRISYDDLLGSHCRPYAVGDDPVIREVTASDDVAGAGCGNRNMGIEKKRVLITVSNKLRAGLGIGVGVKAIQWLALPVAPFPFLVFIDLVCRYVQKG